MEGLLCDGSLSEEVVFKKQLTVILISLMQSAQAGQLEFLIKAVEGTTAALLCDLKVGDEADVSPVMGKGFNMEALQPPEDWPTIIIFATGSGIRLVIRLTIRKSILAGALMGAWTYER